MTDTAVADTLRRDENGNPVYPEWEQDWDDERDEYTYEQPADVRARLSQEWDGFRRNMVAKGFDSESLLDGIEKVYSTGEAVRFFGRTTQWMYWGLRDHIFQYKDGSPILPERVGKMGRRRYTLPLIREIALSCYRRGQIQEPELESIMAKILIAEFGAKAFAEE